MKLQEFPSANLGILRGKEKVDAGWILYLDVPIGALIAVFYKF